MLFRALRLGVAIVLIGAANVFATTYYIATNGSDANDGLALNRAFATFQHAVNVMIGGDVLLVRGGFYSSPGFSIDTATNPNQPVTVKAYPGERPYISGTPYYAVEVSLYSPSILDGLIFTYFSLTNDVLNIQGSHSIVRYCTIANSGFNLIRLLGSDHITLEQNVLDTNGYFQTDGEGDGVVLIQSHHNLLRNNLMIRNGHSAIDIGSGAVFPNQDNGSYYNVIEDNEIRQGWGGGVYSAGLSHNNLIQTNRISHFGEGIFYPKDAVQMGGQADITRYNIFTNGASWYSSDEVIGLFGYDNGGYEQSPQNDRLYNNDLVSNGFEPLFMSQRDISEVTHNKLFNNIMHRNNLGGPFMYWYPAGYYLVETEVGKSYPSTIWSSWPNSNYMYNNIMLGFNTATQQDYPGDPSMFWYDQTQQAESLSQIQAQVPSYVFGNLEVNPQFVNEENLDLRLAANSPAIDAGAHLAHIASSGTATTTVSVDDPYPFSDGFGIVPGDTIIIGQNAPVTILQVNSSIKTLTLNGPVNTAQGDPVDLASRAGGNPDLGAHEYSSLSPIASDIVVANLTPTSATITWTTDRASDSQVEYGTSSEYNRRSTLDTAAVQQHSVVLQGLIPSTTYHFSVLDSNSGSGLAISSDETFSTPQTPGPQISDIVVAQLTGTTATISWVTDTSSDSQVFYGLVTVWSQLAYNKLSPLQGALTATHSVTLTGLTPGSTYYFGVQSSDTNGTHFIYQQTFETPSDVLPVSNLSVSAISQTGYLANYESNTAQVSWTTSTARQDTLAYAAFGSSYWSFVTETSPSVVHSINISQLPPDTLFNVMAVSSVQDANGNSYYIPASYDVTFSTLPDVLGGGTKNPPAFSAVTISSSSTTAELSWITDIPGISKVNFGTSVQYSSIVGISSALTTNHTVLLTGLSPATVYHYALESTDSTGDVSLSADATFSTASAPNSSISISPVNIGFGRQLIHTESLTRSIGVTAGSSPDELTLTLTGLNASDFRIVRNSCGTLVAAHQNCLIAVGFTPAAAGLRTARLVVNTGSTTPSQIISLSGVGATFIMPTRPGIASQSGSGVGATFTMPIRSTQGARASRP
jgi:hypothetical protein